ncbi:hypothetical protein CkaCkLH20_05661 [Colletotrichum karsti]|uniref:LysM domain-containing protein n=1 Tax=Colletotrichum karsti TaxID=1095194 RepID=A0A9P6I6K5_9PEZI|nr:uncharacterized protein CkaCkLH20_05661 [Colletotrichum karsti]KAF9876815.1 hypothetical protein CkaCkLH20_05661 [Colletotrichum karsti]
MASLLRILCLGTFFNLVVLCPFSSAQQLSQFVWPYDTLGLSGACFTALNRTVASCSSLLGNQIKGGSVGLLDERSLTALCTTTCESDLKSRQGAIKAACKSSQDVMIPEDNRIAYPATYLVDKMLYAYSLSCYKDKASGQYCDLLMAKFTNDTLPQDECSDCNLANMQKQLSSPFGYNSRAASEFSSVTASCGAAGYAYVSPTKYALNSTSAGIPSATSIAKKYGLSQAQLLAWNPMFDAKCFNIGDSVSRQICVSSPGGSIDVPGGEVTTTAAPVPTNYPEGSNKNCAQWYTTVEDQYCNDISVAFGISLADFYFLNPQIDKSCSNLWLGYAYCVKAVGFITTYPGYTTSQPATSFTRPPTTTSTKVPQTQPPAPLASGSKSDCKSYLEGLDNADLTDSLNKNGLDMDRYPDFDFMMTNNCSQIARQYGVNVTDILSWNPSLSSQACQLQAGLRYCVGTEDVDSGSRDDYLRSEYCAEMVESDLIMSGTAPDCSCYTVISGGDAGELDCGSIGYPIANVAEILALNPWISGGDCDVGVFAGLNTDESDRAVCLRGGGVATTSRVSGITTSVSATTKPPTVTTTKPATTTTSSAAAPSPTQPGTITSCKKFHNVVSGDGCWSISNQYGISLENFYAWNSGVGADCSVGVWLGYSVCVGV